MAGISIYLADKINDWLHGDTLSFTVPATTYFALMTVMPTSAGGGTEVSGGSYARKAVTNNSTNWPASVSGTKSNGAAFAFVPATADWGLVLGVAEYDAATAGNLLTFSPLATPTSILNTQTFTIPIGSAVYTWIGGANGAGVHSGISHYLADRLNDWLHGGGTYTMPGTTYFGLMTAGASETAAGTEVSGSGYARASETNTTTHWPDSSGGTKADAAALAWGPATGSWTAPELQVAEYDALGGGNLLSFGPLSTPIASVLSGNSPTVPVNGAVYTVT